jgi:hypothetical protein
MTYVNDDIKKVKAADQAINTKTIFRNGGSVRLQSQGNSVGALFFDSGSTPAIVHSQDSSGSLQNDDWCYGRRAGSGADVNMAYWQHNGKEWMYLAPDALSGNGGMAIRSTTVSYTLHVAGTLGANLTGSTGGSDVRFNTSTKEIFYDTSSYRYKTNIEPISDNDSSWIMDLVVKRYDRKDGSTIGEIGFIAEDVAEKNPAYAVMSRENDKEIQDAIEYQNRYNRALKRQENGETPFPEDATILANPPVIPEPIMQVESYNKSDLIPLMIKEMQKMQARIEALENGK